MKKNRNTREKVSEIGPCDVLLGRGTGPNENQGNKMFRDILRKYKEAYRVAGTKKDKREIVAKAIEEFQASGGRFVERVILDSEHSNGRNCYEIVEGPAVSLKARQAFRYLLRGSETDDRKGRQSDEESEPSGGVSPSRSTKTISSLPSSGQPPAVSSNLQDPSITPSSLLRSRLGELTLRDAAHLRRLTSLTAAEAPILASLHKNSSYMVSPWRQQQELIPPPVRTISDVVRANTTDLILSSVRYPGSLTWSQDNNVQIPPRITNSDLWIRGGQHPILSNLSPFEQRGSLLDSSWDRWINATNSDRLRYHQQQLSNITDSRVVVEHNAIEQALLEQQRREKRLADLLLAPNLQALAIAKASTSIQNEGEKAIWELEHERQRQASLHRIMASLPGDRNLFLDGKHGFTPRSSGSAF